jgi:hypothetical protein
MKIAEEITIAAMRLDCFGKIRSKKNPTSGRNSTTSSSVIAMLP